MDEMFSPNPPSSGDGYAARGHSVIGPSACVCQQKLQLSYNSRLLHHVRCVAPLPSKFERGQALRGPARAMMHGHVRAASSFFSYGDDDVSTVLCTPRCRYRLLFAKQCAFDLVYLCVVLRMNLARLDFVEARGAQ